MIAVTVMEINSYLKSFAFVEIAVKLRELKKRLNLILNFIFFYLMYENEYLVKFLTQNLYRSHFSSRKFNTELAVLT